MKNQTIGLAVDGMASTCKEMRIKIPFAPSESTHPFADLPFDGLVGT